ncbi:PKD domain-containing protein [Mumia qirimensis]|uniref:PKD domain-containing protein n=1 Tax=Mumia qirimensis TaxID=3234852 RepID=UPI00351D9EB4
MPAPRRLRLVLSLLVSAAVIAVGVEAAQTTATAAAPQHDKVVSDALPMTPAVNDGSVQAIAQVGSTVIVGGDFTSVTPVGGAATTRNYVMAFDKATGQLVPGFAPELNGDVTEVIAGPTPTSVYIAGRFTRVNGSPASHVALLDVSTGALASGFRAAPTNGVVNSLLLRGNQLVVGGFFTTAATEPRGGIAAVDATTGALSPYLNHQLTDRHNDSGSGAVGPVGVRDMDITPDGSRLVAIGNFKNADGLPRDQIVMLSLGESASTVTADWRTRRYEPYCYNWAFDSYMRGVSVSPDGSYFVVATTGGPNGGTLCDTAARFEVAATGAEIQPTWVDHSGGDTLWGVAVTEQAVYVGGHQRWMNNSLGSDSSGAGSVPRPGLSALDPTTGVPLAWNPGRNPRGAAVYALYPTTDGLWMGSDTEYVGPNYRYRRPRLAFFPLATGKAKASDSVASLGATAFLGGNQTPSQNVLYRVNAGGSAVSSIDSGPSWEGDTSTSSPYRGIFTSASTYSPSATVDATVPAGTPVGVFDSERRPSSSLTSMKWTFPVQQGRPLQVRLYFANRASSTNTPGKRIFDVKIDGTEVLSRFDIVASVGHQRGTMRAYDITSDGTVNIDFVNRTNNPLINAIEIIRTDIPAPVDDGSLRTGEVDADGAEAGGTVSGAGIDWNTVRGSFVAGGKLYYGKNNGTFSSRTFVDGLELGPEVAVDPYNDPNWAGVPTGSGNNFDGKLVDLYAQLGNVTGMTYAKGRLYYTKSGSNTLFWRWFSTDSGIIGAQEFVADTTRTWSDTSGMFIADAKLFVASRSTGELGRYDLGGDGMPTGARTLVDGPSMSGIDWRSRALFATNVIHPPPNELPTAAIASSCVELICTFDGAGSTDPDGSIAVHAWDVAGTAKSGQSISHTFDEPGTYDVSLTVTDNVGATTTKTVSVTVEGPPATLEEISFVGASSASANNAAPSVPVPGGIEAGDVMLLTATVNNAPTVTPPAGWTPVTTESTTNLTTYAWTRTATAADVGATVSLGLSAAGKTGLAITAYDGVDTASPIASTAANTAASTATHTTPDATVGSGSWVVWFWSEKSTATSSWAPGAGVTTRATAYATGTARVSTLVGDTGGPVTGTVPGATATTDTVSGRSVSWSIVLRPAS